MTSPPGQVALAMAANNAPNSLFALAFKEKENRVMIPHNDSMRVTSNVTVELWALVDTFHTTGYLLVKKQAYAIALKNQVLLVAINNKNPGWVWKNTKFEIPCRKWAHIAMTYSEAESTTNVFVNGILIKQFKFNFSGPIQEATHDLYFGLYLTEHYFRGYLADVRIWKKCLDPDDIRRSMTALPNIGQEPDLTGWWRLDTGYGTTAFDLTLNKRDGIIDGAAWTSLAPRTAASHPSTLIEDLRSMFNSPVFSDIRISAGADPENDVIFAHRIILSQRSDVFKAMLTSGTRESASPTVYIQDTSFGALKQVLEFLYTDSTTITGDGVLELFAAADKFQLPRLKALCEVFMLDNINLVNACTILEAADQLQARALRAECMRWILDNFFDVMRTDAYLSLSRTLLKEINNSAALSYSPQAKRRRVPVPDAALQDEDAELSF